MSNWMRHRVAQAVLAVFAVTLTACEKKPAQISFAQTEIDLGTIFTNDAIHTYDVEFRNVGDEPLTISSVWPSCDCVKVERYDTVVAGGKTGTIRVGYDLSIYPPGDIERMITVSSNSADTTDHEVFFHAHLKYAN